MRKDDLTVHVFRDRNWCNTKSDQWFFFLTMAIRREDPSIGRILSKKKYGGTELISGRVC